MGSTFGDGRQTKSKQLRKSSQDKPRGGKTGQAKSGKMKTTGAGKTTPTTPMKSLLLLCLAAAAIHQVSCDRCCTCDDHINARQKFCIGDQAEACKEEILNCGKTSENMWGSTRHKRYFSCLDWMLGRTEKYGREAGCVRCEWMLEEMKLKLCGETLVCVLDPDDIAECKAALETCVGDAAVTAANKKKIKPKNDYRNRFVEPQKEADETNGKCTKAWMTCKDLKIKADNAAKDCKDKAEQMKKALCPDVATTTCDMRRATCESKIDSCKDDNEIGKAVNDGECKAAWTACKKMAVLPGTGTGTGEDTASAGTGMGTSTTATTATGVGTGTGTDGGDGYGDETRDEDVDESGDEYWYTEYVDNGDDDDDDDDKGSGGEATADASNKTKTCEKQLVEQQAILCKDKKTHKDEKACEKEVTDAKCDKIQVVIKAVLDKAKCDRAWKDCYDDIGVGFVPWASAKGVGASLRLVTAALLLLH